MKIELPSNRDVENLAGDFGSTLAGLNASSLPVIFGLLSKGFYSNPIGSICREITSNCFDAHTEAGVDDPVVIKYASDVEGPHIIFKDVGVGISRMRMIKIYMNYFSSSKRKKQDLIGGFGLGSKTPLSYTDYFYITTVKNGKEYKYMYNKGDSIPSLDCLGDFEPRTIGANIEHRIIDGDRLPVIKPRVVNWPIGEDTTKHNGTEIRINLKDNYYDRQKFKEALSKQLCYFNNVWFHGLDIPNKYKIYETDLFKYRDTDQFSEFMHICFGKVSYAIDWTQIGLEPIKIAVGIKFQIGEIMPTPNREAIQYLDDTKELLKKRILEVKQWFIDRYNEQNKPITDYRAYLEVANKRPFVTLDDADTEAYVYLNGVKEVEKKYKYELFEKAPFFYEIVDQTFSHLFRGVNIIDNGRERKKIKGEFGLTSIDEHFKYRTKKYALAKDITYYSRVKNAYFGTGYIVRERLSSTIKSLYKKSLIIGYKNQWDTNEFGDKDVYFNLGVAKKTYEVIKTLRKVFLEERYVNYNFVPEDFERRWREADRANNAVIQRKLAGKVLVKSYRDDREVEMSLLDIERYKGVIIYGSRDEEKELKSAANWFMPCLKSFNKDWKKKKAYRKRSVKLGKSIKRIVTKDWNLSYEVLRVAKNNYKYFNGKNMVHIKDLYSDNPLFRRIASGIKLHDFLTDLVSKQPSYNARTYINQIKEINLATGELLERLRGYVVENLNEGQRMPDNVKNGIMEVANKQNLFDPVAEELLNKVKTWYEGVEIITHIPINSNSLPYILKYLKDNKKSINYEYYLRYTKNVEEIKELEEESQIIIMFPEDREEEQPKSNFRVLTEKIA